MRRRNPVLNALFQRRPVQTVLVALGVAVAYFVAARLGLALAFVAQKVTLVWPPTAVGLAALLIIGYRALPGLVLGAFLANISTGSPLLFCAATAVGNPLEALVGVWLLRRLPDFNPALNRVRDVVALIIAGTILSPPFSATLGVTGLCVSGPLPWSSFGHVWLGWCLGDGMGVLLFAPALLPWKSDEARRRVRERWIEFSVQVIMLTGAAIIVFFTTLATAVNYLPLPYFLLPLLLGLTIRFGSLGAGVAVAFTSAIAVASTGFGMGPFAGASLQANIASLLAFMCMIAIVCLILGAMLAEREKSERMLQAANERVKAMNSELEQRVATRTKELAAANTRLEEIHALQNAILNTANYAVISVNPQGLVTSFNRTAQRWLGYSASEVVGKETPALWHEPAEMMARARVLSRELGRPVAPDFESLVARARLEGIDEFESVFVRKHGNRFPVFLSISALQDADGNITGYVGVVADITERKLAEEKLRESEERFRRSFEDAPIGMALVSLEGRWLRVNNAICNMVGYAEKELLATDFQTITHPDDLQADLELVGQLLGGRITDYNLEKRYFHKRGQVVNVLLSVSLVRDPEGKPLYFVSQIQDITERKKDEAELAAQTEALKRSNHELEQFAYVASHDMQEPLRAISGFSQILKIQCQGRLDEDASGSIIQIIDGAKRMAMLIDDLLTLSRVGSQGRPFLESPLEKSLQLAERNLVVAIHERGAVIRHGPLPALPVDASQLTLLFQNLIGNAIKFCRGRTPEIHVEAMQDSNGFWKISLRDNGIGIESKYFERIFGIFQRLHTRDEYPGTGMGLAICKKIVERHGGTIWLESEPGAGTTFYFTLPEKHLEKNERQPSY